MMKMYAESELTLFSMKRFIGDPYYENLGIKKVRIITPVYQHVNVIEFLLTAQHYAQLIKSTGASSNKSLQQR